MTGYLPICSYISFIKVFRSRSITSQWFEFKREGQLVARFITDYMTNIHTNALKCRILLLGRGFNKEFNPGFGFGHLSLTGLPDVQREATNFTSSRLDTIPSGSCFTPVTSRWLTLASYITLIADSTSSSSSS
jgi:hypothetical protein